MRGHRLSLLILLVVAISLFSVPVAAQNSGANPEIVNSTECVTYPETGPIDLQYCVQRHFQDIYIGGELAVVHELVITRYTVINGQLVNCTSIEQITIANGEIRHEGGRNTC